MTLHESRWLRFLLLSLFLVEILTTSEHDEVSTLTPQQSSESKLHNEDSGKLVGQSTSGVSSDRYTRMLDLGAVAADQTEEPDDAPQRRGHPALRPLPVSRVIRQVAGFTDILSLGRAAVLPPSAHVSQLPAVETHISGFQAPAPGTQSFVSPQGGQCPVCQPLVRCPVAANFPATSCRRPDGTLGVCCPAVPPPPATRSRDVFQLLPQRDVFLAPISGEQLDTAVQEAIRFTDSVDEQERYLLQNKVTVSPTTPEGAHQRFFRVSPSAKIINKGAAQINAVSRAIVSRFGLTKDQSIYALSKYTMHGSLLSSSCPVWPTCDANSRYRSTDGSCNNLRRPLYGRSETALTRIAPPTYEDGVAKERERSATGRVLPNVRWVASVVTHDKDEPDQHFTLSVMQWGQFMDHDITHVPFQAMGADGFGIECCYEGEEITGPLRHVKCLPITIPANDTFYGPKGIRCLNFIRSMEAVNDDCSMGPSEQMNQITHWIDASNVYGSTVGEARRLRSGTGGRLLMSANGMLPIDDTLTLQACSAPLKNGVCYFAGDSRVNEQPGLTAIHTLFHREHNRVARALNQLNPGWSDETLYQEARRVVIAEIQHITYNEWLPIIVGTGFMHAFDLSPQQSGHKYDYNDQIVPSMSNEFATAAFRFGHTLVQGHIKLVYKNAASQVLRLKDHLSSPHVFSSGPDVVDGFVRSFSQQAIQKFDSYVTDDLINHLFQTPAHDYGMDLISLNIKRGRDHGIGTYNDMREVCGLPRARTFSQFSDQMSLVNINKLQSAYEQPDDVDFFVGGLCETPVSGGLLGWTFLCVVGDQFARIKRGDRFFYDVGGQPGSFTEGQLQSLRHASWARVLCDNSGVDYVQPLAFRAPDQQLNRLEWCRGNAIPRVDLSHWRAAPPPQ